MTITKRDMQLIEIIGENPLNYLAFKIEHINPFDLFNELKELSRDDLIKLIAALAGRIQVLELENGG